MSSNNNGFQDMLDYTTRLMRVDPVEICLESLIDAAEYFVKVLLPNVPKSLLTKKHMRDHLKVKVTNDKVTIYFEGTSFYWRFIENGTAKIRAEHFVEGTWQQNKKEVERIMTQKIIRSMEG